jgi:hypothetical protein
MLSYYPAAVLISKHLFYWHGDCLPHVVGWRFVTQRRAINLDANCGWARGKADVV